MQGTDNTNSFGRGQVTFFRHRGRKLSSGLPFGIIFADSLLKGKRL